MKLFVVGATGGTGRLVVAEALRRGHAVKALVRTEHTTLPGVETVRGDVRDPDVVTSALSGSDAVISCLGVRLGQPVGTIRSTGTRVLVNAMQRVGPRRLVVVSTVGVGSSKPRQSGPARVLWPRIVGVDRLAEADLAEQEVFASDLEWTVVRPPRLVDSNTPGTVEVGPDLRTRLSSQLSRLDLARLLVDLIEDGRFAREAVTAVTKR